MNATEAAAALRRIADGIEQYIGPATDDMFFVRVSILPAPPDVDDDTKRAMVDGFGMSILGASGETTADGERHHAVGNVGPVGVVIHETVAPPRR